MKNVRKRRIGSEVRVNMRRLAWLDALGESRGPGAPSSEMGLRGELENNHQAAGTLGGLGSRGAVYGDASEAVVKRGRGAL